MQKAQFVVTKDNVRLIVEVKGEKGRFIFDAMTMTELWAAYHFVRPSADLKALGAERGEFGLVGITKNNVSRDGSWEFGIHPAIANTLVAREAMRLDMALTLRDPRVPPLPSGWVTYQWLDEPAVVSAKNGSILLTARSTPNHILLRVRLWGRDKEVAFDTNPIVARLFETLDAVRHMDRFARIVAVLNWLDDAGHLPVLPPEVRPQKSNVPARWFIADVYSDGVTTIRDRLDMKDPFDRVLKESHHKVHSIQLLAGQSYVIDLKSTEFDTYLRIEDDNGKMLAEDDDAGGNLNARIVLRPQKTGSYRVVATSFGPGVTGTYFLHVWEGDLARK